MQLSGRTFEPTSETTIVQDAFVVSRLRTMGLDDMVRTFDPTKENLNFFSERVLFQAVESGVLFEVIAGILVEDNVPWSVERAKTNAEFFSCLTKKEDKEILYAAIGQIVVDFLLSAAQWKQHSPNSSSPFGPVRGTENQSVSVVLNSTITESGTTLSDTSQDLMQAGTTL